MQLYHWDFGFIASNLPYLLGGLAGTLRLAATTVVLGAAIGLLVGLCRISHARFPRWMATGYIGLFRNTPALVQLLWLYYAVPIVTGVQASPFTAAVLAFSLATGAYLAEIIRAGVSAVSCGQWEAATSLGLGYVPLMVRVILPQALRHMVPAFTNQTIDVIKLTAISSMIAYGDLVYHAKILAEQQFRPIEAYTALAVLYSAVLIPLSYVAQLVERRYPVAVKLSR
jgi:polar amino acid transport system permease protein